MKNFSIINSLPSNHTTKPPKDRNGANGIACLNLKKFIDKPKKQYAAANM